MTSNLLIVMGIAICYILFAIGFSIYVSKLEEEAARKRAQSIFIGINVVLVCIAMTYAYIVYL